MITITASEYRANEITESGEHAAIAKWLRRQYPTVRFITHLAGHGEPRGVHLQDGRKWPDLHIVERRGLYIGFWGEIKTDPSKVFTKKGKLWQREHIQGQWEMMLWLRRQGYAADWLFGFEDAVEKIVAYLERGRVLY